MADGLRGRPFDPKRLNVIITDVRESGGEIVLAVAWDTVPGQAPAENLASMC
jgi:hypothetical protein